MVSITRFCVPVACALIAACVYPETVVVPVEPDGELSEEERAQLERFVEVEAAIVQVFHPDEPDRLATGWHAGDGRIVTTADPSVFCNECTIRAGGVMRIRTIDEEVHDVEVISVDAREDVMLLELDIELPALLRGEPDDANLVLIGHPQLISGADGWRVLPVSLGGQCDGMMSLQAPSLAGLEGAPIVNTQGDVVARYSRAASLECISAPRAAEQLVAESPLTTCAASHFGARDVSSLESLLESASGTGIELDFEPSDVECEVEGTDLAVPDDVWFESLVWIEGVAGLAIEDGLIVVSSDAFESLPVRDVYVAEYLSGERIEAEPYFLSENLVAFELDWEAAPEDLPFVPLDAYFEDHSLQDSLQESVEGDDTLLVLGHPGAVIGLGGWFTQPADILYWATDRGLVEVAVDAPGSLVFTADGRPVGLMGRCLNFEPIEEDDDELLTSELYLGQACLTEVLTADALAEELWDADASREADR